MYRYVQCTPCSVQAVTFGEHWKSVVSVYTTAGALHFLQCIFRAHFAVHLEGMCAVPPTPNGKVRAFAQAVQHWGVQCTARALFRLQYWSSTELQGTASALQFGLGYIARLYLLQFTQIARSQSVRRQTDRQTDRQRDATKCIISLASRSIKSTLHYC